MADGSREAGVLKGEKIKKEPQSFNMWTKEQRKSRRRIGQRGGPYSTVTNREKKDVPHLAV